MKSFFSRALLACAAACSAGLPILASAAALEEVIVTATRRASNVQDIPIAVTAVTPTQLERQGVDDLAELGNVSASFQLQSTQTESQGTAIRIRGIGTTGNNVGLESAVGVFIDGVYISRPGIALGDLTDLEAIEVLRGPQGTLFGRNTTAGAVVIKTAKPNFDGVSGFVNGTVGNFNAFGTQAGINLPVNDTLAFRFTGSTRDRDGFVESEVDGNESYDRDRYQLRAQALWEPTEDVSLRFIADFQDSDEQCCASFPLSQTTNPLPPALLASIAASTTPALGFSDFEDLKSSNDQTFVNTAKQEGFSVELNWNLNENVTMTYVGSYRDFESTFVFEEGLAVSAINPGIDAPSRDLGTTGDFIETTTHELRFNGTAFDDKLDWLVGFYYSDEDILEDFNASLGPDFGTIASTANFGFPTFLNDFAAAGNAFTGGMATTEVGGSFAENRFKQNAESKSIFTHLIYSVTEQLDVTLGLRYVDDEKEASFEQLSASNDACASSAALGLSAFGGDPAAVAAIQAAFTPTIGMGMPLDAATLGGVAGAGAALNCFFFAAPAIGTGVEPILPHEFDEDFSDEELVFTLQAGYKVDEDTLIYGGFTHGYKAGGFNLDALAATGGNSPDFNSELIDAYELGVKSTLNDGLTRLNAAVFYNDLEDFQVLDFTGLQFETFNAEDVTTYGLEIELTHNFSDALSGDLAITYTKAEYGDDCDDGGALPQATPFCGFDLSNSPEVVIVAGLTHEAELADTGWFALANVSARYQSDRRSGLNPTNSATGMTEDFDEQDSHTKVNARLIFTSPSEKLALEIWGVNLTDEVTRSITFNTALITGSRSAFFEDPRTYGATARYKF